MTKNKSKPEPDHDEEKVEHKLIEEPVLLSDGEDDEEGDGAEEKGGFTVKRMPWLLQIEGVEGQIPLSGMKLPMLTIGAADGGEMLIETPNVPGNTLNFQLNTWLRSPSYRKLIINVLDVGGVPLEVWKMDAKPSVMGFSPLDIQDDAPWVTQMVLIARDITIEQPEAITPE